MQPLLLDALLLLIIVLLIPIGVHRGGLREVCTAAGLLLGMHLVNEWAVTWGGWLADLTGIVPNVMTFIVAVLVLLLTTGFVGYGATAAFASSPGAGGRMYGAILAFLVGAIFLGSVVTYVDRYLYEGETPRIVVDGYISRALSFGIGWILLCSALVIVVTTLFGMIVRERDADEFVMPIARVPVAAPSARIAESSPAREAEKIEPVNPDPRKAAAEDIQRTAPIKIREVRHWDEPQAPEEPPRGSRWNQTWPQGGGASSTARSRQSPRDGAARHVVRRPSGETSGRPRPGGDPDDASILSDWLAEDGGSGAANGPNRSNESNHPGPRRHRDA